MAEPVRLTEFWAQRRSVSTAVSPRNTEATKTPGRAALKNSPQNTDHSRLLNQVRAKIRVAHYSIRTESDRIGLRQLDLKSDR